MKEFSLSKKVILISGASGLIGTEISDALASAGAKIILLDRKPLKTIIKLESKLKKKYKTNVKSFSCDISNELNTKNCIKKIIYHFGKIDVLINLAAIDAKIESKKTNPNKIVFHKFPLDLWNKSIDANITGTFVITKLVIKEMLKKKSGNIINVASTYSLVAPNHDLYKVNSKQTFYKPVDYVVTKSMIPNFTRYISTFYGKKGIRANTIVPHGVIDKASAAFKKNFRRLSPIGRICDKKELRGPFIFLSSEASSYMNGSIFVIDGGWTAW
jgi:NAD(P)-dependent dehydrogenase (short-subunit alcohol dehydrogenase family)